MYVKSISIYGIIFLLGLGNGVQLELYADVDYAHEASDRRTVFGGVIMCAGACVSFYYRTQKSITPWSTGTEYVAMVTGFHETFFMRYLWSYIFPDFDDGCTMAKEDNQGVPHSARKHATTPDRNKIDARRHFPRKRLANGELKVVHVSSALQHNNFIFQACVHQGVLFSLRLFA